jgi:hypothetical protein
MRWFVLLILLSYAANVFAITSSDITDNVLGERVGQIGRAVDSLPIDNNKIDIERIKNYNILALTGQEKRLEDINLWIESNAIWLESVFGMAPSLTWLFAVNFWLFICLFVYLCLMADTTFGVVSSIGNEKVNFGLFGISFNQVVGFVIFAGLIRFGVLIVCSNIIYNAIYVLWNYILPYGIIVQIICLICFGSGAFYFIPLGLKILKNISVKRDKKREWEDKERDRFSSEAFADA